MHHTHAGFQSCPTSTVIITQSATSGIATVTQTVATTVYVSIHPSTADCAICSSRVTAASNSSTAVVSTIVPIAPVYGSVVDYNDTKPIYNQQPGTLPNRTEGSINVTGVYTLPWAGSLGGSNLLVSLCTLPVLDYRLVIEASYPGKGLRCITNLLFILLVCERTILEPNRYGLLYDPVGDRLLQQPLWLDGTTLLVRPRRKAFSCCIWGWSTYGRCCELCYTRRGTCWC